MFLPLLAATVLSADPAAPPPSPPPLVPTEAAVPVVEAPPSQPVFVQERPRRPRSPKRGLTIAGVAVFGASYGLSLGVAAINELAAASLPVVPRQTSRMTALFVPVVGPVIAMAEPRNSNDGLFGMTMVLDALVQAGGLTLLIVGLALPEPAAAKATTVWFTPTVSSNGAGAAFGGTF